MGAMMAVLSGHDLKEHCRRSLHYCNKGFHPDAVHQGAPLAPGEPLHVCAFPVNCPFCKRGFYRMLTATELLDAGRLGHDIECMHCGQPGHMSPDLVLKAL